MILPAIVCGLLANAYDRSKSYEIHSSGNAGMLTFSLSGMMDRSLSVTETGDAGEVGGRISGFQGTEGVRGFRIAGPVGSQDHL